MPRISLVDRILVQLPRHLRLKQNTVGRGLLRSFFAELFLANHESAFPGGGVTQSNLGKDPVQALDSTLDKLEGISGAHGKQSHVEK